MRKPAHRTKTRAASRDPERTRQRILTAALREFSAKGLAGARVDAIARRAGVNKRMLYHYFGNKHDLFSAVLRRKLTERDALLAVAPEDASDALAYWFAAACNDPDWIRLLEWEALQAGEKRLVLEGRRRVGAENAVERVRRRQARGLLKANLDTRHLLLSVMALTAYPLAFPQVTRLVTGRSAFDPAFQDERREFLRQLADALRGQVHA